MMIDKTSYKIKDYITLNEIETVILLSNVAYDDKAKELVDGFVVTDEVRNFLDKISDAIKQNKGVGFFIYGVYGTGKSHFLSFLTLSLLGIAKQYDLSYSKLYPIPISLQDFSRNALLQDIIFREIESKLDIKLPVHSDIINDFNKYFLSQEKYSFYRVEQKGRMVLPHILYARSKNLEGEQHY